MIIRDADNGDWPQIFPFFRDIVAAGETYAYPEDLSSADAQALWMAGAPDRTIVAVDGETIVGSAKMGPNRPGRGSHIATASFMVDPTRRGGGVGRALGEEMIYWARGAGFQAVQFNAVVETNASAVRLWQSLGFEILTTIPASFDHRRFGRVGLHIMYLQL